ncbi:MAG: Ig-like domain repeat protein, partial [Acidobacteriia bacterium]|nr:Ig-like domain repeat protein [Terriglobia bacterium]
MLALTRTCLIAAFALAAPAALFAQTNRITAALDDAHLVSLPSTVSPKAHLRNDQGRVDSSLHLPFVTLMMKPSDAQQADLEQLLSDQLNASSPDYHRWLTPDQFGERFGLSASDYSAVVSWLESHQLHVEQTARARNFITFSGTAQFIETTFHTELRRYLVEGQVYYANSTNVSVPAALSHVITGIRGLDDFWRLPPAIVPHNTSPSGTHQLAPADWAAIYDVSPVYAMGINGAGVRIGVLGRSDMNQSFIDQFRSQFGLPPAQIEQHLIGPDPGLTNAANEASLDLEWSGAIAPGATIVFIYAGNVNDAAQGAIDQNLANILSESFGTCEPNGSLGTRLMGQQANAQGITWVSASGDSGAACCDPHGTFGATGNETVVFDGPAVSMPASFPEVTAVGGTEFNDAGGQYWSSSNGKNGASALSYIPEIVWNDTGAGGLLASGGGASIYFPRPAWQTGPGVPADNARHVPDIAFSASGGHDPYLVVNSNGQRGSGGTSASTPSFAGVVALLNHYLITQALLPAPGLGNINPELYRLAASTTNVFHDITQGNNMVACAPLSPGCVNGMLGFAAGPGYDQATGLGSIDVYNFVQQWNAHASATSVSVAASPSSIPFGGSVQLTATVTPAAIMGAPTGTVTFTAGHNPLGTARLINSGGAALATVTVNGPVLPAGATAVTATYSGDSVFNSSAGSTTVGVAAAPPGSQVTISITPNPVHEGQAVRVSLTEEAGVSTTITGWTINGNDDFSLFTQDFGTTVLPAYGTLFAGFFTNTPTVVPSPRVYQFTGVDADGRTWSRQYTLTLAGPLGPPAVTLFSAPSNIQQNPSAAPSCQWTQQLVVQENLGFTVELTRLAAGSVDWTSRLQTL